MSAATTGNGVFCRLVLVVAGSKGKKRDKGKLTHPFLPFPSDFLFLSSQYLTHFSHTITLMHMSDSEDELPLSQRAAINNNLSGKLPSPVLFSTRQPLFSSLSFPQVSLFQTPPLLFQSKRKNLAIM